MTPQNNMSIEEAQASYEKKYAWSVWIFLAVGFLVFGFFGVLVVLIFYYLYKRGISFGEDEIIRKEEHK